MKIRYIIQSCFNNIIKQVLHHRAIIYRAGWDISFEPEIIIIIGIAKLFRDEDSFVNYTGRRKKEEENACKEGREGEWHLQEVGDRQEIANGTSPRRDVTSGTREGHCRFFGDDR